MTTLSAPGGLLTLVEQGVVMGGGGTQVTQVFLSEAFTAPATHGSLALLVGLRLRIYLPLLGSFGIHPADRLG